MKSNHDENTLISLQEKHVSLFPETEDRTFKQDDEYWLEQPLFQKVVDSTTSSSSGISQIKPK